MQSGLVVYNSWDLDPLDLLNSLALGCYQASHEVLVGRGLLVRTSITPETQKSMGLKTREFGGNMFLATVSKNLADSEIL